MTKSSKQISFTKCLERKGMIIKGENAIDLKTTKWSILRLPTGEYLFALENAGTSDIFKRNDD